MLKNLIDDRNVLRLVSIVIFERERSSALQVTVCVSSSSFSFSDLSIYKEN